MSFKKIDREFLLTDNSVNVYGFRLLTEGYLLEKVKANPIGYYMHGLSDSPKSDGVLVRWSDHRIEDNEVYAKPTINLNHPRGKRTIEEIENGFLNAASVGEIVVVEYTDDLDMALPGQIGPTITKWYNKETSIVDKPGNLNALASPMLFDLNDKEINLTHFIENTLSKMPLNLLDGFNTKRKTEDLNMKKSLISLLAIASIPNLSDTTTDEVVLGHVRDLVDKANRLPGLEIQINTLTTDKNKAVQDLADYKKTENTAKIKIITDAGVQAGKLTVALVQDLSDKYANDPEGLQKLVDGLPAYKTVTSEIAGGSVFVKDLSDMSWEDLDKSGKLPDLKAADLNVFKAKFKAQFGTDYNG